MLQHALTPTAMPLKGSSQLCTAAKATVLVLFVSFVLVGWVKCIRANVGHTIDQMASMHSPKVIPNRGIKPLDVYCLYVQHRTSRKEQLRRIGDDMHRKLCLHSYLEALQPLGYTNCTCQLQSKGIHTLCMQIWWADLQTAPLCKPQCLVDLPLHQFHSPCNFQRELLGSSNANNC